MSLQVKNESVFEGCLESLDIQDDNSLDVVLHYARLVLDDHGKPCLPAAGRHGCLTIKARDRVKIEALNVPTSFDTRDNQTANGGLATDSDIARNKGVGYVPT